MTQSYRYRAARQDGTVLTGRIEAGSELQAGALLVERGLHPIGVEAAPPSDVGRRTAPRRELAIVFRSLAALTAAGVPLVQAVAATEGLAKGALKECLQRSRACLRDGQSLAQALDADRGVAPPVVLGILRAGERAGRLSPALEQVATHLELEADLMGRLRQALAYPTILATAGLASVIVIGTVVVPKFAALLGELGEELPPATRLLLALTGVLSRHGLLVLVGVLALIGGVGAWIRHPVGSQQWHRILLATPGVGPIRLGLATVRVCRALGGSLQAGMPLLSAFDTAREASGDLAIGARLARARERIARGEGIARALNQEQAVTSSALQLIAVGESSGQLGLMFARSGDLAAQEADRALNTLVSLLEPLLVIVLGGFIAFVAAAMLQALYSLRPVAG